MNATAKQVAIDRINQKLSDQLGELSRAQAATQHGFDGVEASNIDFDMSAENQMQALSTQLKDGQLAVVQQALKEREMMEDQVNQLTGLVDNLLGMVRKSNASELTRLSATEQEITLAMERT